LTKKKICEGARKAKSLCFLILLGQFSPPAPLHHKKGAKHLCKDSLFFNMFYTHTQKWVNDIKQIISWRMKRAKKMTTSSLYSG